MTKKERIAEPEREIADIRAAVEEVRARPPYFYPYWSVISPSYGVIYCQRCGASGNHFCNPSPWYYTTSGGTSDTVTTHNVTYIGATG